MPERLNGCLHVNEDLAPLGGAELMVRQIGLELHRRSIRVGLVSVHQFEDRTGLKEYILPFFNGHHPSDQIIEFARQITSIMDNQGYDLLHVHNVSNSALIREIAKTKPVFKSVHDPRVVCPAENRITPHGKICREKVGINCLDCMEQLGFSKLEREKRLYRTTQNLDIMNGYRFIFTPSRHIREQLLLNGVSPDKAVVVPLFITPTSIQKDGCEDLSDTFKTDILFVGRLIEAKGINELIEAFSLLNDRYNLTIVGNRPSYVPPRDFVEENKFGQRVKFVGWVNNNIIDKYYQGAKVCAMPSMWPEAFGLVGLEAMKNKKPVVAFDSGGIADWLYDGENGYLVQRGDTVFFADRIKFLLENPQIAEEMGERGYEILVSKFTKEAHIDKLLQCYHEGLK